MMYNIINKRKGEYVMFCSNCGKELDDNAVVCTHCGCLTREASFVKPMVERSEVEEGQSNGIAIAGFVCSFFIPLLGWIFGGVGLSRSAKQNGKGKGFSIASLVIASIMFFGYLPLI